MNMLDVCYTPLDVPAPPEYDINEIKQWCEENFKVSKMYRNVLQNNGADSSAVIGLDNYPWDMTIPYFNLTNVGPGWVGNFDKKFPELSDYFFNVYGLDKNDVGVITFLPMKKDYTGYGFWHRDPDPTGLRLYLEFEGFGDDKLFLKKTRVPYDKDNPPIVTAPVSEEEHKYVLQEEEHECKILKPNQAFYLNNFRSVHATWTDKKSIGKTRIAVLIVGKKHNGYHFAKSFNDLIVKSAEKYKDYAILWDG